MRNNNVFRKVLLITVLSLSFFSAVFSQDSTDNADSSGTEILKTGESIQKYLSLKETADREDSLKIALLNEQIKILRTDEDSKRSSILKQLDSVKNSTEQRKLILKARLDSLKKFTKGAPVNPFGDTLFTIYMRVGGYTAAERANSLNEKIRLIQEDKFYSPDSLLIIPGIITTDIVYKGILVLSITENDELIRDKTSDELARNYREEIIKSIGKYREENSLRFKLEKAGMVLIVLLVLVLIGYGVSKLSEWINRKLVDSKDKYVKSVRIYNYEILTSQRIIGIFILINKYIKITLFFLLIYFSLPVLLKIFPRTAGIADRLLAYIFNPLKNIAINIWDYFPNLITIIIIVTLFRYVLKALIFFRDEIINDHLNIPGFYKDWANPTFQIIRFLIFAFMLVVIFPYLPGSNSPVFQGVSVFLGFLLTFGSAGSLSNIIAGIVLTYMRAFKLGDRVKIADVTGDITGSSLLVTRIRSVKNEDITIPNSNILSTHTINYSSSAQELGLILNTTVTIGYDAPWRKVHQLLISAAEATEMTETDPKPFVLQTSLDDYYVSYQINVYTKNPGKQAYIYSRLHQNIQDKFNEAGVEIMSPQYNSLRDGNSSTIPADYLPKDYESPAFKTENRTK